MKKTQENHSSETTHRCACPASRDHPERETAQEHQALNELVASSDERSRHLFLGFLALVQGRGSMARLSRITGVDRNTISRGRRELLQGLPMASERIRRPGEGRHKVEADAPKW